jgi:hypothetical protein
MQQLEERNEIKYRPVRLSETTIKRLQKKAIRYGDSYETIVSCLLNLLQYSTRSLTKRI